MSNTQYSNANIELQIIEELMHLTVTAVSFEELARRIVERCAGLLDAELCTLWRLIYAVPLISNDRALGVLKIENSRERGYAFSDVDKATFDVMADFIALALELNSRIGALRLLSEIAPRVAELIDVDTLLNQIAELAAQALNWPRITIWLFNENRTRLWLRAAYGPHKEYIGQHYYNLREGLTGRVAETGKLIRVRESYNLEGWIGRFS